MAQGLHYLGEHQLGQELRHGREYNGTAVITSNGLYSYDFDLQC